MQRIVQIAVLLLLLNSCAQKSTPLPPSPHEELKSLDVSLASDGVSISRIAEVRVLTVGQTCSPGQSSPIRVRLDQINIEKKACLLQVEDPETGHALSGWVEEGQYASFAPDEVGTGGLEIAKITPEEVTVCFYSCRYVELRDGKPVDE